MYVASYRNTERSAQSVLTQRLAEERRLREAAEAKTAAAERAAWEARIAEEAARKMVREQKTREVYGVPYRHTFKDIERRAIRLFGFTRKELYSERRNKKVAFARQFIMYWAARLTPRSYPEIGRLMGGRDHTTCLWGKYAYREKRAKMGRHLREAR